MSQKRKYTKKIKMVIPEQPVKMVKEQLKIIEQKEVKICPSCPKCNKQMQLSETKETNLGKGAKKIEDIYFCKLHALIKRISR